MTVTRFDNCRILEGGATNLAVIAQAGEFVRRAGI